MKTMIIVALALVAVVVAVPVDPKPVAILRSEFEQEPAGGYRYGYETENGIQRQEQGEVKEVFDEDKKPHDVVVVRGSYSYTQEDGSPNTVNYYADETGFHAEGPSIPKPARR